MDINIDAAGLSAETRRLLIRFQQAQLRHQMNEAIGTTASGEWVMSEYDSAWLHEYIECKKAFQTCPEKEIASIGMKFDFGKVCEQLDRVCTALVESGQLKEDDYQEEFNRQLDQHCKEVYELEAGLIRLSLQVADARPPFFKQLN